MLNIVDENPAIAEGIEITNPAAQIISMATIFRRNVFHHCEWTKPHDLTKALLSPFFSKSRINIVNERLLAR